MREEREGGEFVPARRRGERRMERGILRRVPSVPAPTMRRSGSEPAILMDEEELATLRAVVFLLISDGTAF